MITMVYSQYLSPTLEQQNEFKRNKMLGFSPKRYLNIQCFKFNVPNTEKYLSPSSSLILWKAVNFGDISDVGSEYMLATNNKLKLQ